MASLFCPKNPREEFCEYCFGRSGICSLPLGCSTPCGSSGDITGWGREKNMACNETHYKENVMQNPVRRAKIAIAIKVHEKASAILAK